MTNSISISTYVNDQGVQKWIESALGERKQQFVTSLISLVNDDIKLQAVDKKSLVVAAMTGAALNLPVNKNLGFAYIIPYNDKHSGKVLAQLQIGWKGFVQLGMRSGQYRLINATDVREGEIKKIDHLSGEIKFKWAEENREKLPVVGYVSFFKLKNGFKKMYYMTSDELKAHGVRYSQTMKKGFGLWVDDFDAMASKTVIKLLISKFGPMTSDMETAQIRDQAVAIDQDEYIYLDNKKETAEDVSNEKERQRVIAYIADCKTIDDLEVCEVACTNQELKDLYESKAKEINKPGLHREPVEQEAKHE